MEGKTGELIRAWKGEVIENANPIPNGGMYIPPPASPPAWLSFLLFCIYTILPPRLSVCCLLAVCACLLASNGNDFFFCCMHFRCFLITKSCYCYYYYYCRIGSFF